jgi:hypothetical protein
MKIVLPSWVYRNLTKFRNVALPNSCNKLDRDELIKHLSKEVGFKVKLRDAIYKDYKDKKINEYPYLIAEAKR